MLFHRIYLADRDDKKLVYKAALDEVGNIVQSIDFYERPPVESTFEYDNQGRLIRRSDQQDGLQDTAQTYRYDQEAEILEETLFFSGTEYDKTIVEKNANGFIRLHFQDGEEVEHLEKIVSGKNWTNNYYTDNELLEVQEYTYDESQRHGVMSARNLEFNTDYSEEEFYDENDQLIRKLTFGEDKDRQFKVEIQYANGKVIREDFEDYISADSWSNASTYDDEGRLINFESRSKSGELHGFRKVKYNDTGRIIEEAGRNNSTYFHHSGYHTKFDIYHLLHEYSEGEISTLNEPN